MKLKMLYMFECEALEEFDVAVSNLIALEELDFGTCQGIENDPEKFFQPDENENIKIESCRLRNSKHYFCPPNIVITAKCDEIISPPSMLQERDHNGLGELTTTLFSPISVGYHLETCVAITFLRIFSIFTN